MPPKGEGKGKGGKGKGKGGIADFSDMKKEMPSLPPAPAAEKVNPKKTDASPVVSPRSAPRWGSDLPPVLNLSDEAVHNGTAAEASATGTGAGAGTGGPEKSAVTMDEDVACSTAASAGNGSADSTEAADAAAASSVWMVPPSAALVAMEAGARRDAIDDALARLMAEGLATSEEVPGSKDAAAVDLAECVKAFGVQSLWNFGALAALQSGLTDVKNAGRCEGALCGISALVRRCGPWFEPYVLGLVPDMLLLLAHKALAVREAAYSALVAVVRATNPRAARLVLPLFFTALEHPDWRVKQNSCQLIGVLAKHSSSQLNICMPLIVPRVTVCLRDTKKEVAKAAKVALITCCGAINNPDIQPVVSSMVSAIKDPEKCPEALEDLMHTTFVHPVDASSLSIIVPILSRSLTSRGAMHEKRKAATVVINMCKLVLNPSDVEPFVPRLLPELRKSAEDAAFEEIRGVCSMAEQVLLRAMGEAGIAEINAKDKKAREAAKHEASEAMVNGGGGVGDDEDKTDF